MSIFVRSLNTLSRHALRNIHNPDLTGSRNIKRWVAPTLNELKRRRDRVGPEPPERRSTFLEWNYDAEIYAFGERLGESFSDYHLRLALVQKSYITQQEMEQEKTQTQLEIPQNDNSELVKEGEELITNYLKEVLENQYVKEPAEEVRNYLTSQKMLSHVAKHIGLTDLILSADFPVEDSTLANTFKAVIGALKHSSGTERAEIFVKDFLLTQLNDKELFDIWAPKQPYEYLMNLAKETDYKEIEPRLCNQSATNTILANYQVGLYSNKKLIGIGWGESIEIAKDSAALDAIQKIYDEQIGKQKEKLVS